MCTLHVDAAYQLSDPRSFPTHGALVPPCPLWNCSRTHTSPRPLAYQKMDLSALLPARDCFRKRASVRVRWCPRLFLLISPPFFLLFFLLFFPPFLSFSVVRRWSEKGLVSSCLRIWIAREEKKRPCRLVVLQSRSPAVLRIHTLTSKARGLAPRPMRRAGVRRTASQSLFLPLFLFLFLRCHRSWPFKLSRTYTQTLCLCLSLGPRALSVVASGTCISSSSQLMCARPERRIQQRTSQYHITDLTPKHEYTKTLERLNSS